MNPCRAALLIACLAAFACAAPGRGLTPAATVAIPPTEAVAPSPSPGSQPTVRPATATPAPSPTAPPPDLDHRPLYWFAPLPPQPTGPYDGSDDYMDLFTPESAWTQTAGYLHVFKLYGGWVAHDSTDTQLRQAIDGIRQRGLALAVEVGPLNPTDECGIYIEGFAGEEGIETLRLIKAAGGRLDLIAFDEPYFYGHFSDQPNACHWPAEQIAQGIDAFIQRARAEFPEVIIGDIEPLSGPAGAQAYQDWLDTFRAVNGYDPAFLLIDVDWSDITWPQQVKAIEEYGRARGVPIGIIYTGNFQDQTDEAWLSIAGERAKRYELDSGGQPDHVVFQSWHDRPDRVLPETEPYTFTGFVKTYFEDKAALGLRPEQSGNVALKKPVHVSQQVAVFPGESAVDGDPGTLWNAGDGPPQWIEIDLGAPYDIREIRLVIGQYPDGPTLHQVRGSGPGTGGAFVVLTTFEGATKESQLLAYAPPEPWQGIQVIRIETAASPSWVAWREIEVLIPGSTP